MEKKKSAVPKTPNIPSNRSDVSKKLATPTGGPLPTPDAFERYNLVLPGAADRIIAMVEKEQNIRRESQDKILTHVRQRINSATFTALALIVVAGIAVWKENLIAAILFGLAGPINTLVRQLWRRHEKHQTDNE